MMSRRWPFTTTGCSWVVTSRKSRTATRGPVIGGFASRPSTSTGPSTWAPEFDGSFYGPWDILVRGNQVWVGGAFKTVSGIAQSNIARFTDVP